MVNRFSLGNRLAYLALAFQTRRAVEMFARNVLAFFGVEVLQIGLGHRITGALPRCPRSCPPPRRQARPGWRSTAQSRRTWCRTLFEQVGLVLPGDQHVALVALRKGDDGAARAGVSTGTLPYSLATKSLALLSSRFGPPYLRLANSHAAVVPARAARGLGVGRDHLHRGAPGRPSPDALGLPWRTTSTMVEV